MGKKGRKKRPVGKQRPVTTKAKLRDKHYKESMAWENRYHIFLFNLPLKSTIWIVLIYSLFNWREYLYKAYKTKKG